jgi:hypothetical protein
MHFTYSPDVDEHLCQGDIITKTKAVESILTDVHPHYLKNDYKYFIVLTQSCDLVRRNGNPCKARYITIAAVRPLDRVLQRELEGYQSSIQKRAGIASDVTKSKISEFFKRVLNNNHPNFFYLHNEPSAEFGQDCCAFLQLSIAIRSAEHYETLLGSRILSLNQVFRAKLGWLVGNLYSRVGTEDWVPAGVPTDKEFNQVVADHVDGLCQWLDKERLAAIEKALTDEVLDQGEEVIRKIATTVRIPRKKDRVLAVIDQIAQKHNLFETEVIKKKFLSALSSDSEFSNLLK